MKQNIKNTLYRFVTMRAPELIGSAEKLIGFVNFPENETSAFITPASQATTPEAKKLAIENAINTYTPNFSSKKDLENENIYFYYFATWLTSNRTKFSLEEITARVDAYYAPQSTYPNMVQVWDDLHYNILTNGDSYLRDMLLSWLVADFFLTNRDIVERTAENLQKMAQARVVINKNLFDYEVAPKEPRTPKIAEKHFKKEINAVAAKQNIIELESIAKEVAKARSIYDADNTKAKAAYQKTYDTSVRAAYDAATVTERVVTDSNTGETSVVKEYTNLTIPDYNFLPTDELDKTVLASRLSAPALQVVNDLEAQNNATTLQEIEDAIAIEIQTNTDEVFENTDFESQQVVIPGGISVPVSTDANLAPFSYSLCPRKKIGTSLYNLLMTINVPNSSYDVVNVLVDDNDGTFTSFTEFNLGSKISLVLCTEGIDLSQSPEIDIEIEFSNGEIYDDNLLNITPNKCKLSQLYPASLGGSTSVEAPVVFGIQRLGIADYRKVEQEVCCYVPGEVSHIENIMAREYKSKDVKRTRRQETTDTFSSESERENLTETTSTDRFEMNQEIASISAQDQSTNASAGIRWGGNKFGGDASASFANSTSSEESESQAITHAKELTERALDRVVQKVREERVTKVVEEYEETTSHGFDNRKGDKHVSGVYRWVDKVYENKLLNYGKRLMYEFMIPEPASFHDLAIQMTNEEDVLVKPVDPRTASFQKMKDHKAVNATTYKHWAAIYNAEVSEPPVESMYIGKAFSYQATEIVDDRYERYGENEEVTIPEGYYTTYAKAYWEDSSDGYTPNATKIIVGSEKIATKGALFSIPKHVDSIPVSFSSLGHLSGNSTVSIKVQILPEAKEKWQLETFNAIIEAYEERIAEYNEKLAAQKEMKNQKIDINPGFFREIEKTVLRKNCITYLLGHDNLGKDLISNRQSITEITARYSNASLDDYAAKVKFFEQAFEWDIMSYYFYPFYWANKEKWGELYQIQNNDPLFKAFLQSGMARVIITVRPGFEEMVNWYMATGQIWNGGQVPTLDDEEFVSIVEELRNPESEVEETWETRVPTSLTVIQAGAIGLNVEGLPCNDQCDDWLRFDTDGNPVVDADGNPISDNPIVQSDELVGGIEAGVGSDTVGGTSVQ
ncbi:hypothetical protein [uncultured Kordia sp.]|uniref:hypothetical protein n=1 Tax=uncultured Kordia sp. TaxID=507699 RepID=UPI0026321490|nr:hypothetical protein [uncultured Kordia sp.]